MFGYVLPQKAELKVREWAGYRAYYCGLCKQLKREYGFVSRLFLNYDLVLVALLADSLSGEEAHVCAERCMANPVQKRPVCASTKGLALAADALVLTVYYKLRDDVADERFFHRIPALLCLPFAAHCRKKAAGRHPELDCVLAQQTQAQQALEKRGCADADEAADPTAQMTAALFSAAALLPQQQKPLARLGMCIGKIIYYLDAAEDYDKDAKRGAYNAFRLAGMSRTEAVAQVQTLCRMCAGEASLCYNLLAFQTNKSLLDNILFLGIPQSIALAGMPHRTPTAD